MHLKAKKSLGQNFLIDREVLEKIVSITDIADKEVLEIGPGSGNLTTYILKQKPKKLYVIEKDDDLAILLKEKFDTEIEIINDDILYGKLPKTDSFWSEILSSDTFKISSLIISISVSNFSFNNMAKSSSFSIT